MDKEYNVEVTKKNLFGITKLKGTILKNGILKDIDWMGFEYNYDYVIIKLENGKTIKIIDFGFNRYSYAKI